MTSEELLSVMVIQPPSFVMNLSEVDRLVDLYCLLEVHETLEFLKVTG